MLEKVSISLVFVKVPVNDVEGEGLDVQTPIPRLGKQAIPVELISQLGDPPVCSLLLL